MSKDFKKLLGSAKITFVLGGPGSGKGTQCQKLVDEFNYKHISVGDLMRAEISKGTKEGERIKKIVADGQIVPYEVTVDLLVKALISSPSKNYLIDGFPRAVDQAVYFEQIVSECQLVLNFEAPEDILVDRLVKRGQNSGRIDDNPEAIAKRIKVFNETTRPVVDLYQKFGRVRNISSVGDVNEVFQRVKEALMPEVIFLIGAKGSGKTTIGTHLAEKEHMKHINFHEFVKKHPGKEKDDHFLTQQLIKSLYLEVKPRLLIEGFPQNAKQAKFFINNCTSPSSIIYLKCSQDVCQERMNALGKHHPQYLQSSKLSKEIKNFHLLAKDLLPYLKSSEVSKVFFEINGENSVPLVLKEVARVSEPTVIHIRGQNNPELKDQVTEHLVDEYGFMNLDVNNLITDEIERKTDIGKELLQSNSTGKVTPPELIVKMIRKIIYSGSRQKNFILNGFPDTIEQAVAFEENCSGIAAALFLTKEDGAVQLNLPSMNGYNIDTYFQKQNKLKIFSAWNPLLFEDIIAPRAKYILTSGAPGSGKTVLSTYLAKKYGFTRIELANLVNDLKKKLGTDDEPLEVVPVDAIINELARIVNSNKNNRGSKVIIDGLPMSTPENAQNDVMSLIDALGLPEYILTMDCSADDVKKRLAKKLEIDELSEEQQEQVQKDVALSEGLAQLFVRLVEEQPIINLAEIPTSHSEESSRKLLDDIFSPTIILLLHDKSIRTENLCVNFAIQHNLIYISVYQEIKKHIENETDLGKRLVEQRNRKELEFDTTLRDEFQEGDYSAANFNLKLVVEVVNAAINEYRTDQRHILLEGYITSYRLKNPEDKMSLRFMDEYFTLEREVGPVIALVNISKDVISVQPEQFEAQEIEVIKPPVKEKAEGDEDEDKEPEKKDEEEEEEGVFKYKKEDYKWTYTNGFPRNFATLFPYQPSDVLVEEENQNYVSLYEFLEKALSHKLFGILGRSGVEVEGVEKKLLLQLQVRE